MPRRKSTLKSRKINGKKFSWKGWGHTKDNAKRTAKNLRELGYKVRIIPTKASKKFTKVWDIYARKK